MSSIPNVTPGNYACFQVFQEQLNVLFLTWIVQHKHQLDLLHKYYRQYFDFNKEKICSFLFLCGELEFFLYRDGLPMMAIGQFAMLPWLFLFPEPVQL
jgi:hypothetical protein